MGVSSAKDGEKEREKKKQRLNDGNNNGQLRIANGTSGGTRKATWANYLILELSLWDQSHKIESNVMRDWSPVHI